MAVDPPRIDEEGTMNITFHANPKNSQYHQKSQSRKRTTTTDVSTPRNKSSSSSSSMEFSFDSSPSPFSSSFSSSSTSSSIYYPNDLSADKEGNNFLFLYRLSKMKLLVLTLLDLLLILFFFSVLFPSTASQVVGVLFAPQPWTTFSTLFLPAGFKLH
jgi:hypothetical protein